MLNKDNKKIGNIISSLGTVWLGVKNGVTFYSKRTVSYGNWNIVWNPATVSNVEWTGGSVNVNAYAIRTNIIREGFSVRNLTEKEYCSISYSPTLSGCSLNGTPGETGYTFKWGEYNETSSDRKVTLTATHTSGTSTLELTLLKRNKYVTSYSNIRYTSNITIPAEGGTIRTVTYDYIVTDGTKLYPYYLKS